jgi:hypothetical protein
MFKVGRSSEPSLGTTMGAAPPGATGRWDAGICGGFVTGPPSATAGYRVLPCHHVIDLLFQV